MRTNTHQQINGAEFDRETNSMMIAGALMLLTSFTAAIMVLVAIVVVVL
jgi:hypothetical protein